MGETTIPLHKELIDHRLRSWPRTQVQYCNSVSDEAVARGILGLMCFNLKDVKLVGCPENDVSSE